ncbi:MAG: hypothetical protein H0S79_24105, partial [Anaerolineaceae bacterium]|nr:hypothetical protein [Anaerolineaceae bacterium]
MKKALQTFPIYAFLFPIITVLILVANNLGQMQLSVAWRPLWLSTLFTLAVFLVVWPICRSITRAGLLAFIISFFALTYGHFYEVMEGRVLGAWVIGTPLYTLIIWGLMFALAIYLLMVLPKSTETLTQILNIVILALFAFQLGQIGVFEVQVAIAEAQTGQDPGETTFLQPSDPDNMPDVYFILLDKYGRSDALEDYFDYDNSDFIQGLEDLGFWVADCSRSNYAFTVMSLSSELNMDYVYNLTDTPDLKTTSALIQNNRVFQAFEEVGYTTIAFNMGYSWGNMKGSDYYFASYPEDIDTWEMDPFELMVLNSTIGRLLFTQSTDLGAQVTLTDIERKAARTTLILDVLPEVPELSGPKFVYAHIINPHPPYVFNADGTINENAEDTPEREGYPAQLAYLEPRILDIVAQILANSEEPPIIIIEGDHAFGKKYVTSNLLALYLPDGGDEGLDGHMTLVNVFPTIFNTYFGTDIEYLPDESYTHTKDWYESV